MTSTPLPERQNYLRKIQFQYNSQSHSRRRCRLPPLSRMPSLTFENSSLIISSYMHLPAQSSSPQKISFRFHRFHFHCLIITPFDSSEPFPFVVI